MSEHAPERFREGAKVHCQGAGGEGYTLCGYALKGENGNEPLVPCDQRITCADCIRIIRFCKSISRRDIKWGAFKETSQ